MAGSPGRTRRAIAAFFVVAGLLTTAAWPVSAQEVDLCAALLAEELAAAVPGSYDDPSGMSGFCQWHGTTTGGEGVDMMLYSLPASSLDASMPGVEESTIDGRQAFSMTEPSMTTPTRVTAVVVGDEVIALTVSTADASVDLAAAAAQLAGVAAGRFVEGLPTDAGPDDAEPEERTHPEDPCTLFSTEELSAVVGATLTAFPDFESCRWDSADGTSTVIVNFPQVGLTTIKTMYPQGEDLTVGGQPAYQTDQGFQGLAASQVDVDLGPDTMSLLVTSTDETLDAAALALQLAESAFGNGLQVLPEPEGVVTACGLATPEEVAAAAGLSFTLTVQDHEIQCTYEGGKDNKHILIYVAVQDPATFEMAMQGLGGSEIEGPGETSWWLADYGSLGSLQGDLALQVTVMPDKKPSEAKLQQMASAIMEALLAP